MRHILLFAALVTAYTSYSQLPAFPGAEGFGALATGGRGKQVYKVINLNDSGPGSFRDAVSEPNRTVIFEIAGVIRIGQPISVSSNITIAGQTAPGNGIIIYGNSISFSKSKNIIARYLTLRGSINMPRGKCVLTADSSDNIIFDHISVQWGRWDNLHIKGSTNITLQYCIIGEAIDPQRFGALLEGPKNITIHHCLWISNQSRNPKAKADIEYINNIIYNWGGSGFVGGHSAADHHQDIINNYFIAGPSSKDSGFLAMFTKTDHTYQSGNKLNLKRDGKSKGVYLTNEHFIQKGAALSLAKQFHPEIPVITEPADRLLEKLAKTAGNSKYRDAIDNKLIGDLMSLGLKGTIIHTEAEAGGQKDITSGKAPADTDGDGLPDEWEKKIQLRPNNAADAAQVNKNTGYTWIETYINSL